MAKTTVWQINQLTGLMGQGAITIDDLAELLKKGYRKNFPPIIEELLVTAREEVSRIKNPLNRIHTLTELVRIDHNPKDEEQLFFFSAHQTAGYGFNIEDDAHKIIAEELARKGDLEGADKTIRYIRSKSVVIKTGLIIAGISNDPARLNAIRQRIADNEYNLNDLGDILVKLAEVEIKFGNLSEIDKILGRFGNNNPYCQALILIALAQTTGKISDFKKAEEKIALIANPHSLAYLLWKIIQAYIKFKMLGPARRAARRVTENTWIAPVWSSVAGLTGSISDFKKARLACQNDPRQDEGLRMLATAYAQNLNIAQARAVAGQIRDPYNYALSLIEIAQILKEMIEN